MGKKRNGKDIKCKVCNKVFYVPSYRVKTARFCSLNCQNHKQYERFKFNCLQCGKESSDSPCRLGIRKFCSIECYNTFQVDRKSDQREKRRLAIASARIKGQLGNSGPSTRKFAFLNKEGKCQFCGYDEYKCCLDVHHIDQNPNNNKIENLAILCVICHRKVHRKIIVIDGHEIKNTLTRLPKKSDKITEKNAEEIKNLLKQKNMTHKQIAEIYGVKRESITKINRGVRWKT